MSGKPETPPPLSYEQAAKILARLCDVDIVLIGGQAVNFWAAYYHERLPQLADHGPYTSKDIDFTGAKDTVAECARLLDGKAKVATLDDATPNTGTVVFRDEDGHERQLDFLMAPAGLTFEETKATSVSATISSAGSEITFQVMHPLLCLDSRLYNVAFLDGYQTIHARNQLQASILCAREYVRERLDAGESRIANKANERIYRAAFWRAGMKVYADHGIDVFAAVVDEHEALLPRFRAVRYPSMKAMIERKRVHALEIAQRRAVLQARPPPG